MGTKILYVVLINILAFILMGVDKNRAQRGAWRISEKALFASAIAGGSIGAILGMKIFRHKTKHWYFVYGMPCILVLQVIACFLFREQLL